jgi:quinol monooxygenase YgiN
MDNPEEAIPCSVLELRQYTLHPGKRDTLIELFDRELVETQEAVGMRLIGQFRDLDRPDHFVWIRAFRDMAARARALAAFYGGPVWAAHRNAANSTMVDSDDVLLLRPSRPGSGFPAGGHARPPPGSALAPTSLVVATLYALETPVDEEFVRFFEQKVVPILASNGAPPIAYVQTEPAENNYPALPVRTGENVFLWFASFRDPEQYRGHLEQLARSKPWTDSVQPNLLRRLKAEPQRLRLAPTARSGLR